MTKARRLARLEIARPLVDAMKPWGEGQQHRAPPRGTLTEAIRYALARWQALCRFLDDGHKTNRLDDLLP